MSRALAALAVLVTATALLASARTVEPPSPRVTPPPAPAPASGLPGRPRAERPERRSAPLRTSMDRREAVRVAVAYALATRNWSARTLRASWRAQHDVAAGAYRRSLNRARPRRGELDELTAARASSIATLAAPPTIRRSHRRAAVTVTLHERTATAGAVANATTANQVLVQLADGRWRVTGWTVLPGTDGP